MDDPDEKLAALKAFTDHVVPEHWAEVRPPTPGIGRNPGAGVVYYRSLRQGANGAADRCARGLRPTDLGGRDSAAFGSEYMG